MNLGILGKKIGMTRVFDDAGSVIPVTVIQAGPCPILQVKRKATDGYTAIQLGFDPKKERRVNRPDAGHFAKSNSTPQRFVREIRMDDVEGYEAGGSVTVESFEPGDRVDVVGVSKGRGFAGAIKKHGSSRGPETHGSRHHRRTGSLGASATPSHVFKGGKIPGQMGAKRVTTQGLKILRVDKELNLLIIKGAVPGHNDGYLIVSRSQRDETRAAREK